MSASPYTSMIEDMSHFVCREPVVNPSKSRTSYINKSHQDQTNPRYQMTTKDEPRLRAPFGISVPLDEKKADSDRKDVNLEIKSENLLKVLNAWDEYNVQVAHKNCKAWFGKEIPIDHIRFMYCPIVKPDKTGKYSPTFKIKINTSKNTSKKPTRFFMIEETDDGQVKYLEKDFTVIKKNSRLVPIVEPSLWFNTTQFGGGFTCTDVIVFNNETEREEFPFQWGDTKPVPMEVTEESEQQSDPVAATQVVPESAPTQSSEGWVPPAEPSA
jgi:hypothetical protein